MKSNFCLLVKSPGKWTAYNGEAHFDVRPNAGSVLVNGTTKYEGSLSGYLVIYI